MTIENFIAAFDGKKKGLKDFFPGIPYAGNQAILMSFNQQIDGMLLQTLQGSHQSDSVILLSVVEKARVIDLMKTQNEILELLSGNSEICLN